MKSALDFAIDHLLSSRATTLRMIADVPPDKLTTQLDGAPNHFLFTLGHLALTANFFGECIGATPVAATPEFQKAFGYGVKPVGDSGAYPPVDEVRAFAQKTLDGFVAKARTLTPEELEGPCPNGGAGVLPNRMEAILSFAWHDGWHAGQLSPLRRHLGLPSLMG